jgi:hypothetical protein
MRSLRISLTGLTALTVLSLVLPAGSVSSLSDAGQPAASETKPKEQDKLKELLKERLVTARELEKQVGAQVRGATAKPADLIAATRLANEAALEICETDMQRIKVLESFLAATKENERLAVQYFKAGQAQQSSALIAVAERLRVEMALERARAKGANKQGDRKKAEKVDDQVTLAEKRVAVKQAAARVSAVQKKQAQARLHSVKAQVVEARAYELFREKQLRRVEDLEKRNAVDARTVDETRAQYEAARARREAAEGTVAEAEIQIELEQARLDLAQAEVEEAQLRLKQLQNR